VCILAATLLLVACDDDPTRPDLAALTANLTEVPDSLSPQGAIRVRFNRAISPGTATDPANFVVTDTCTGLRVPGTLRVEDDSIVVFTPGNTLPFLSVLAVRIQNILDTDGGQLAAPVTFARTVQGPPVGDVSWDFLNSPTSEKLTGISFVDRDLGFLLANNGTLYRTQDGGQAFAAIFKDLTITDAVNVRAFGPDTLYMAAARTVGGNPTPVLLRSTNGGLGFQVIGSGSTFGGFFSLAMRRAGTGQVGLVAGVASQPEVYRYESATGSFLPVGGLPGAFTPEFYFRVPLGVDLSRDTTKGVLAIAAADLNGAYVRGEAYRSVDGGRTFAAVTAGRELHRQHQRAPPRRFLRGAAAQYGDRRGDAARRGERHPADVRRPGDWCGDELSVLARRFRAGRAHGVDRRTGHGGLPEHARRDSRRDLPDQRRRPQLDAAGDPECAGQRDGLRPGPRDPGALDGLRRALR
jgi:hypothetical protein